MGGDLLFVHRDARRKGVSKALLEGGIAFARKSGARVLEACPIDGPSNAPSLYVGEVGVFRRAGFREAARRRPNRPLMRLPLGNPRRPRAHALEKPLKSD